MNVDLHVRPQFRIALLLAAFALIVVSMSGCAAIEDYAEAHPQIVAGGAVVVAAGAGILVAKSISKSGRTQIIQRPPAAFCGGSTSPECTR